MSTYAIRVELNGRPSADVYERLHDAMSEMNAHKTIVGATGAVYDLPHATYVGTSEQDSTQVRDLVIGVVEPIWRDCDVIVFLYDGAAWKLSRAT